MITGISAASTPIDAIRDDTKRERSGQIRSASSTTRIVAVRTISGASAWKSMDGFTRGPHPEIPRVTSVTTFTTAGSVILKSRFG